MAIALTKELIKKLVSLTWAIMSGLLVIFGIKTATETPKIINMLVYVASLVLWTWGLTLFSIKNGLSKIFVWVVGAVLILVAIGVLLEDIPRSIFADDPWYKRIL